jgi:6-phosphofructokinase 1
MIRPQDLLVSTLGEPRYRSPLRFSSAEANRGSHFVSDESRILAEITVTGQQVPDQMLSFEEAGPRERTYFDPSTTTTAMVTCGGLSPGLNNVIRSVFAEATYNYGIRRVLGIRNGYQGLNPAVGAEPIELTADLVEPIDKLGGTVLGTSRGPQDPTVMADFLQEAGIDILFCLGGDGTQRGAHALQHELARREVPIAVVGIPKTIDNDIPFVSQSFGYVTALEKAAEVIRGAHVEARGAVNGIGLVKLMGRHAGFIAAGASVISQEVNFTLVPEVQVPLEGEGGFLAALEQRMRQRGHAVVVVAEGAGQHLFRDAEQRYDASGNPQLHDFAQLLRGVIPDYLEQRKITVSLKYLDPSYLIRSVPADVYDRFLCDQMGRHAVHAAMAGKTDVLIGYEHNRFIHVPIPTVVGRGRKVVDGTGDLWRAVLQVTGQPVWSAATNPADG